MKVSMNFSDNKTALLWRTFMPRRSEIQNRMTTDLISMQVYPNVMDFQNINPTTTFEKWAAVEVSSLSSIPDGMESFILPSGLYAVFHYQGSSQHAESFFRYVFSVWLPSSVYEIDFRPHFELLGAGYKPNDANSEEWVWIPIREK
jgi:AraC family transcriptional regulator